MHCVGKNALIGIALAAAIASSTVADAAVATFTGRAAFDAAIAGMFDVEILDFDGVPVETLIPSGSSLDGVTFTYTIEDEIGPYELIVIDSFETTSGLQSLGLTSGDVLLSGDAFTMTFDRTIHAVGLYVLADVPDNVLTEGDMELRIPGKGSVTNAAAADLVLPGGGGAAWFLGLIEADPAAPGFNQADVLSSPPPAVSFEWNVDDVVSAVTAPEPGGAAALAAVAALAMMGALRRPRSRRPTAGP